MNLEVRLQEGDIQAIAAEVAKTLSAAPQNPLKILWTEKEAGDVLGVSALTLKKWRLRGLIKSATETKPILYRRDDLDFAARFITSDAGARGGA